MPEHTPTPWAVYDDDDCAISAPDRIFDDNCGWDYKTGSLLKGDEGMHGRFRNPADAAFVVLAVNSHEGLLAALRAIMDTDCVAGETPFQVEQRFHAIAHRAWNAANARAGGS